MDDVIKDHLHELEKETVKSLEEVKSIALQLSPRKIQDPSATEREAAKE